MWKEGTIGIPTGTGAYKAVHYWVKAYKEPSEVYGLEGGRISKLALKMEGSWVADYDRGWDVEPTCREAEIALEILKKEYN